MVERVVTLPHPGREANPDSGIQDLEDNIGLRFSFSKIETKTPT